MNRLHTRGNPKKRSWLHPLIIVPWLLYAAAVVWYPIHISVVARERVAAGDLERCGKHAASAQALQFCRGDYARDLEDAREIHWNRHPLWNPIWLGLPVLFLPLFAVYGLLWIMTRNIASVNAGIPSPAASRLR